MLSEQVEGLCYRQDHRMAIVTPVKILLAPAGLGTHGSAVITKKSTLRRCYHDNPPGSMSKMVTNQGLARQQKNSVQALVTGAARGVRSINASLEAINHRATICTLDFSATNGRLFCYSL